MTPVPANPAAWAAFAANASGAAEDTQRDRLLVHAADGVLALLAGQATAEGHSLQTFTARHDLTPIGRAGLQAALMRHTEVDDIHRPTAVTATAIALPPALTMGPGASVEEFLDALFVGQGIAVQAAAAMGGAGLLARGVWPSYLAAPIGAAAAAGRMLGLSSDRMQHALALALAQVPRAPGRTRGARPGRWLLFGQAVRCGCLAAAAAQDGIDGDPDLLRPASLAALAGAGADLASPPNRFVIEELSIKPHAAAKQTLAAVHALQRLLAAGLAPEAIDRIDVYVPGPYALMLQREPAQVGRLASMVSMAWQLALVALRPKLLDDVDRQPAPTDDALLAFASLVHVQADPALDALYPDKWPARVAVTASGHRHELLITDSPGDPARPYDKMLILDKAQRVLGAAHPDLPWVDCALGLGSTDALSSLRQRLNMTIGLPLDN